MDVNPVSSRDLAHVRQARSRCLRCCPGVTAVAFDRLPHRAREGHGLIRPDCQYLCLCSAYGQPVYTRSRILLGRAARRGFVGVGRSRLWPVDRADLVSVRLGRGGVGADFRRVPEGPAHRGSRAFHPKVERVMPTVRYVSVEGPVTLMVPGTDALLREIAARYLPPDKVRAYIEFAEAELGEQVALYLRPERWLTADLGPGAVPPGVT